MKRADYKERKGGFEIARGKWVKLIRGMDVGGANILMTGQFLLKVPDDVDTVEARFVRVYPGGKRDGTGDVDLYVGHRAGRDFQHTWSHPIKKGGFTVDVELKVPGTGNADMRYAMGKVHY